MKLVPLLDLSQRVPPQNLAAEQALLGAILANNKAYELVSDFLRAEHFVDPIHQRIYDAIVRRIDRGGLADGVSIKQEFENAGILDEVGGTKYLADLLAAMVGIINAGEYGRAVHDAWLRRELIGAGEALVNAAFDTGGDGATAATVLERHEEALTGIATTGAAAAPLVGLGEAMDTALRATEAAARRGRGLAGITTGFAALDRMTAGLQRGEFFVLAARPAMGKTALGLAIAARAAAAGAQVLFWSGEMSTGQLAARAAAAWAGISTVALFTGRVEDPAVGGTVALTEEQWAKLMEGQRAAARLPLLIDERGGLTVTALRARARKLKREGKLDLIVADYLNLLRGSAEARRQGVYAEVTEKSADLKALAKELQIPLLCLAQINRQAESREDKRPNMSDLRDSGAIEQDADRVAFIFRPHYYLDNKPLPDKRERETDESHAARMAAHHAAVESSVGVAEIIFAKNRLGPAGHTRLRFQAHTTWFYDESESPDSAAW